MKKLFIFTFIILTINAVYANEEYLYPRTAPFNPEYIKNDDMKFYSNYAEQIKKERSAISNALQLSDEQAEKRLNLIKNNDIILDDKFQTLYQENIKLRLLKSENAPAEAVQEQKNIVECIKKDINNVIEQENEDFKNILDHQQRSKLNMIKKLERRAINSAKHQKDYYKLNPKMRKFAPKKN